MGKSTYFALLAAGASVLLIGFAAQLLLGAFGNASFITMG
jgi:hypothetical protein